MFLRLCSRALWMRIAAGAAGVDCRFAQVVHCRRVRQRGAERALVRLQRDPGVRSAARDHVGDGAGDDHVAARVAALGAQVDDPVCGADHVEVVLDHHQRMAGGDEAAEGVEQPRHVVEMQSRRRLVEQEQRAARAGGAAPGTCRRILGCARQEQGELQPLRFAARQRRDRLAEPQVVESHFGERRQRRVDVAIAGEERARLGDRHREHVGDRPALERDVEHLGAIALAVAIGAAQVDVGQELHLHVLEAVAATGRTAARARIEAERARRVLALARKRRRGKALADRVERADVARRIGARGAADRRLVDQHDLVDQVGAAEQPMRARGFRGLALGAQQRGMQYVLHQRRLARSRDAGDAHQPMQRNRDVDALQIVLGGAEDFDARAVGGDRRRRRPRGAPPAGEIVGGERAAVADELVRRAEEHDLAAALAGTGAEVEHAVRGEHHLRIVLDDDAANCRRRAAAASRR